MNRYGLKFILLLILLLPLAIGMTGCSRERNGEPKDAVSVAAEDYKKVELLNETAGELYRQTSEGNYPAARQSLASLADQMTGIEFVGITKVEGIRVLSESIVSTKRIFNSVNFPKRKPWRPRGVSG
ncbi:hypothetical protein N6H14_30405 [Paenibacillus sp. CC-CFT747]|nr:hypothetical protein N6H14_30405 [Paenibacillus sp. CC-CFT747]